MWACERRSTGAARSSKSNKYNGENTNEVRE
jgi:hypothetical protein